MIHNHLTILEPPLKQQLEAAQEEWKKELLEQIFQDGKRQQLPQDEEFKRLDENVRARAKRRGLQEDS